MNIQPVTGGAVHAPSAYDERHPACRTGSYSGLGLTLRRRTTYKTTDKNVTCKKCLARQPKGQS